MGFLDFINTSFLLTLGLILLICGGIMLYCYRRLNVLENSVIEHGKILHDFISNYNMNQMMMNRPVNMVNSVGGCCDEVSCTREIIMDEKKIEVSDDEGEDDDDESDSSSDSCSDSSSDDDKLDINLNTLEDITNVDNLVVEKLGSDDVDVVVDNDNVVDITDTDKEMIGEVYDDDLGLTIDNLNDLKFDNIEQKIITLTDSMDDATKKNLNKLRVDELRELVVTKNLKSNEQATKLKKNDLIKVLEQ
jgi:hypothetical protein